MEKEIICAEINNLSREDKIQILTIIRNFNPNLIKTFPDGSRIDLDLLPNKIINFIYDKIKYILKLEN